MQAEVDLREKIVPILDAAEPSPLRDQIRALLVRRGDRNRTHRRRRVDFLLAVKTWAGKHLADTFDEETGVAGVDALDAFRIAYPHFFNIDRPFGPALFYEGLQEAGLTVNRRGARITLTGLELV